MELFTTIVKLFVSLALVLTTNSLFSFESNKSCFSNSKETEREICDVEQEKVFIIKSLVDPSTITHFVKENYPFSEPLKSRILSVGVNDMYLVETKNNKYVLRLSRVDKSLMMTPSEFRFELEWLEFLNQNNVPVSYPIRRANQQLYGVINAPEGPRYATLFSYAEGTTEMSEEQAFILGKSLAEIHLLSDNFETKLNREHLDLTHLIDRPLQQLKEFLDKSWEKEMGDLEDLAENLKKQILRIDVVDDVYGIIAGDIHGYNQHFTSDNQLTMFDFEFCSYGYRVYDLATFRWSRGSDNLELWHSFLKGYQSVRELNDSELQAIDAFVKARNLWWMGCMSTMPEYKHELDHNFWKSAFSRF